MSGTQIPQRSRDLVKARAKFRCERCGVPAPEGEWHHRRGRSVVDVHRHCPCNGVWLCRTCHVWAHQHPTDARKEGWIVSRWIDRPYEVPVITTWGLRFNKCDGKFSFADYVTETEEQPWLTEPERYPPPSG